MTSNSKADAESPPAAHTSKAKGGVPTGLVPFDDASADRIKSIAELAYQKAKQRNFAPGHDVEDWLEAEKEVGCRMERENLDK